MHPSLTRYHRNDNTCAKFRISEMSVLELPCMISSTEEALYCLMKITKLIDELRESMHSYLNELRSHLNKAHERNQTMYNSMVAQLQNLKIQMQPQAVPVSDLSLSKVNPQKIFVSADIDPDLYPFQGTTRFLSKLSNLDPQTSRLQTQTRFVTPLSCVLEPDITKPTSRKIVVSAKTKPSKSDPSSFRKPTQMTKLSHFHQVMPLYCHIVTTAGLYGAAEDKKLTTTQSTSRDSIYKSEISCLQNLTQMIKISSFQRLNISKSEMSRL